MSEKHLAVVRREDVFKPAFQKVNPKLSQAGSLWVWCYLSELDKLYLELHGIPVDIQAH